MTNLPTLADQLFRHAIGYDPVFQFSQTAASTGFPPHNIEKISEDHYRLSLAVAGFSRDELTITVHKGILSVKGKKTDTEEYNSPARQWLYRGIASRDFSREFKIGEHIEVAGAYMQDGLLVVDLERQVPEAEKPKVIAID